MRHHTKNTVIWDLSGTLFRPNNEGLSIQEQEDYSLVFLLWSGKKEPSRLDTIALNILGLLGQQTGPADEIIRMHTGKPLPEILCAFLAGHINSSEALEQTLSFFDQWAPQHLTFQDQQHVRRLLSTLFNPDALVRCMKPINQAVALLKMTAAVKNNNLYILSNWDHDSFEPFYRTYEDSVFSYIKRNHIVISAQTGYVKPQRGIYQWLIRHHNLNPATCFFIDDQQENIKAAKAFGIDGTRFTVTKAHDIEIALADRNLI